MRRRLILTTLLLSLATAPAAAHAGVLSLKALGPGTLQVSWQRHAHAYYELRWRASGGPWKLVRAGRHSAYRIRNLTLASAQYGVQLRACRGRCGGWSATALSAPAQTPVANVLTPPAAPAATTLAGCPVFPPDNPWNEDVSGLAVSPNSAAYINSINAAGNQFLHADFGTDPGYGIPYSVVAGGSPQRINFTLYGYQSDQGPYPVALGSPIEAGSDHHVLVLDSSTCMLYEMWDAAVTPLGWDAGSGAVFNLRSDALRPDTWTSADAAGLPILPGLVRYDEVASGQITHALRFTVPLAQYAFIHPATHPGTTRNPADPPMGLRLRLRADFNLAAFHGEAHVILTALKRYGMIVADQGGPWYITGASDPRWSDQDLNQLKTVPGSAFEVVDTGAIIRPPA